MHVIDDDRFGVGLEIEFIVADADLMLRERNYVQVCYLDWNQFKHSFELYANKKLPWVEALLSAKEYQNPKHRWDGDIESYGKKVGWARLIVMFGLQPRATHWYYKNKNGEYLLRTAAVKKSMAEVDPRDEDAVKRLARGLSRYYVRMAGIETYGGLTNDNTKKMFERVIDVLSWRTGHQFKSLSYEGDDDAKTQPDWYVSSEDTDSMRDYYIDAGIEINTPVMTPREALLEFRNIASALREVPFRVYTGSDCGLHINISHPDVGVDDVSILEFALLYDEAAMAKPFGRSNNSACESYAKLVRKGVREFVRNRIVSLAAFDSDPEVVVQFIESSLDMRKMSSMNLGSLYKYGFVEYRLPGGKRYLSQGKEVRKHLIELLEIHQSFGTRKKAVQRKVRQLLVDAGASKNDGVSLIEMVPRTILQS